MYSTAWTLEKGTMSTLNGGSFLKGVRSVDLKSVPSFFTLNQQNTWALRIMKRVGLRIEVTERLIQKLPEAELTDTVDFTSCAVVGNSNDLLGSGHGPEIDKHTAVFRFNRAPTGTFEEDVGNFTTIRIQNPERSGWCEQRDEILLTRGYNLIGPHSENCKVVALSPQFNFYSKTHWSMFPPPSFEVVGVFSPFCNF
ncbi:hypothetical protein CYMTET_49183 [Cymbomonas tetramitiformis]|uniref:beta-galactoside alpha-(2,6)-sialyltransferase n=1 Tax=Cymbomonas tetramitiformis TaxID=36881 RepID=A0AAE0BS00_9CHLO|nr:hypothetical protein CYMTET_49183 [Cymbomonas tetramitiformis]|eukprot:gene7406-8818_t